MGAFSAIEDALNVRIELGRLTSRDRPGDPTGSAVTFLCALFGQLNEKATRNPHLGCLDRFSTFDRRLPTYRRWIQRYERDKNQK